MISFYKHKSFFLAVPAFLDDRKSSLAHGQEVVSVPTLVMKETANYFVEIEESLSLHMSWSSGETLV